MNLKKNVKTTLFEIQYVKYNNNVRGEESNTIGRFCIYIYITKTKMSLIYINQSFILNSSPHTSIYIGTIILFI